MSQYLVFSTGKKQETRLSIIIRTIKKTSYKWIQAFWTSQLQISANQIGTGVVYGSIALEKWKQTVVLVTKIITSAKNVSMQNKSVLKTTNYHYNNHFLTPLITPYFKSLYFSSRPSCKGYSACCSHELEKWC